jgi:hypothetical protein
VLKTTKSCRSLISVLIFQRTKISRQHQSYVSPSYVYQLATALRFGNHPCIQVLLQKAVDLEDLPWQMGYYPRMIRKWNWMCCLYTSRKKITWYPRGKKSVYIKNFADLLESQRTWGKFFEMMDSNPTVNEQRLYFGVRAPCAEWCTEWWILFQCPCSLSNENLCAFQIYKKS